MSLVYKKGVVRNGSAPCYLYGYGSYGFSYDPGFNRNLVSLLDRGFLSAPSRTSVVVWKWGTNGMKTAKCSHKMNTIQRLH